MEVRLEYVATIKVHICFYVKWLMIYYNIKYEQEHFVANARATTKNT